MRIFRTLAATLCAISAASCVSARNGEPSKTWESNKSVDALATCLVPALLIKHTFPGDPDVTHYLQTIIPGRVYEVQPQQIITLGVERYFVRLTVKEGGATHVELFADSAYRQHALNAVNSCA